MKHSRSLALLALALAPLGSFVRQDGEQPPERKPRAPVAGVFGDEAERLTKEVEGSWMLMEYIDPDQIPLGDAASGFMTFHQGLVTWMLGVEAREKHWFRSEDRVILQSGAYRYRFDESASLQLASVLSYSNDGDGILKRERSLAFEYTVILGDDLLELSDPDGVRMTYRRIKSGEFPEEAIRRIESGRSRTPAWDVEDR